ncbi:TonB-dependent receptor [Falsiroseomonas tokyonensis]|uniref:TonB-dependent receptor n=1 Tax=Falsiroseomonas tokyonensis TaxID=430521 RepID=A0ABV7BVY1_9PROT|nr:TonB-dependent receptor [Falsiroseomonas tokyonensis]MBU8539843.1 TonB-dependent receptor [Falsiroseomonas tokyonensis]
MSSARPRGPARFSPLLALAGLAALPALAQAPAEGEGALLLGEVSVTATRAPRPVEQIPQTVQVIGREEIERQLAFGNNPAAAISRLVPGFSMTTETISGASETFRGRDVLVLLDGVPLNTPLRDVSRILALIDLNAIERIETVAGGSSLYGAGATGGTINLITRRGTEPGVRFTADASVRAFTANPGRSIQPQLSLGASGRTDGGFDYALTATGRQTNVTYDGAGREMPSDALLGQGGGDRTRFGNFTGRIGYDIDSARRIELSGTFINLEQDPSYLTTYTAPRAAPDFSTAYTGESVYERSLSVSARYTDQDFALGRLAVTGFHNDINKRFSYSRYAYPANSVVYYSGNPSLPTDPANQTTLNSLRSGLNVTVDTPLTALMDGLLLTWGGDLGRERTSQELLDGRQVFSPLEQTSTAAFGQLQVPVGERITLRGGLRYERFDLDVEDFTRPTAYFGISPSAAYVLPALNVTGGSFSYDALTANLGATFRLSPTEEIYGGWSQGFALPDVGSFTRRAGLSLTYACTVARPNCLPSGTRVSYASIAPEAQLVDSYEFGIRHRSPGFNAGLVGFASTSDEGVTFDPGTNRISQQKELIYGVEAHADYALTENFRLGGMLTWREGRYDSNADGKLDAALPNNRIPSPIRGALSGTYSFDGGTVLRVEGVAFSGRNETIDMRGTRYKLSQGATMNISAATPIGGGQGYVAVENLFDAAYQNPTASAVRNLPVEALGRVVTLGYRITF